MQAKRTGGSGGSVGAARLPESSARTGSDSSQGRARASAPAAAEEVPPADRPRRPPHSIGRSSRPLPTRPGRGATCSLRSLVPELWLVTIRTTRSAKRPPRARPSVIRSINGRSETISVRPRA